jgi:hypothetical protein
MNLSLSQQTQEDSNKVPQITSVTSSQNAPVKQQMPTETMEVIASNYVPDAHFGVIRPPVSVWSGHPFQFHSATCFGIIRPPMMA